VTLIFLFLIVSAFVLETVLLAIGGFLIIADPLEKAQAVAVLSGGGMPRMEEAARLYQAGYAQIYILTETGEALAGYNIDYIEHLKLEALKLGIPPTAIRVTDQHADSTYDEAVALRQLMEREFISSCIVITDPFHTMRTRLIFRDVFKGSNMKIIVRPVSGHWYRSSTWWATAQGRKATIEEYIKLFVYWFGLKQ
jgi:uncharacterized SAM-binding protein YcdF (DUF218 family)